MEQFTSGPKGGQLHNDDSHGFTDPNMGGGPRTSGARMPVRKRGGAGTGGHRLPPKPTGRTRGSSGSPATRGGTPGSFHPDKRVPGHGGSPQKGGKVAPARRGGFTADGQRGAVAQYPHSKPPLKSGNTSGRSHKLIAGRFQRKVTGGGAQSMPLSTGSFGSSPVTEDT